MKQERFYALDVFRGATVALMILVNNPGSWSHIYAPLEHAHWHGCTPTDLVFPFFLFAVGNAIAFVLPGLEQAGNAAFWSKVLKRTALIFLIGLFLNWFPFVKYNEAGELVAKPWAQLRIMGVLQRIALSYGMAMVLLHWFKARGAFVTGMFLLLAYWFVCLYLHPSDPFSLSGWFGTELDKRLLGEAHLYRGEGIPFDPEGLASGIGPIVQVLMGYFCGAYILSKGKTAEMINGLFVSAAVLLFAGFVWDMVFPINKKIWTGSYVIYTTGLAQFILAVMLYLIEIRGRRGVWSRFFDVFGKNPLFIFMLSGMLPRLVALIRLPGPVSTDGKPTFISPFGWYYEHICRQLFADPRTASLLYAISFIVLMWLIVWWMDRRRIYVKV
jgi:predicted acyltransferase